MREFLGTTKNIRTLLGGAKFAIDFYQREYRWETKQVVELIDDLTEKFFESHDRGNDRAEVENYGRYFLGSIIVSDRDGQKLIIDGQQRLTSLTLLLIYIYHHIEDATQKGQLSDLIFSQRFGRRSFNLDIPERDECMNALFNGEVFYADERLESVGNIVNRYQDIQACFPPALEWGALPYFADWLIENVYLVEITTYSDADAYTIFETMNDRGLSLRPTDMLKGYLLAKIADPNQRNATGRIWQNRTSELRRLGKEADADAIKSWLRSQYAGTIREHKRGSFPGDFDRIGTEFHRWVRDNEELLGLSGEIVSVKFIEEDFIFYSNWYKVVREAAETFTEKFKAIYFNAENNFTLQYPMLLAPLRYGDSDNEIAHKLRIVANYIDILIARRTWNWKDTSYSTMHYGVFQLVKSIRGKSVPELAQILIDRLNIDEETFVSNDRFYLHGRNGQQIHRLLARMTDFVETNSGRPSRYTEYVKARGRDGYGIEHIWANHPEWHSDEFGHPADFTEYRNYIGGLLLLPKSFGVKYGDMPYARKREHYLEGNLLAQSLHEKVYEHDPGFLRFIEKEELNFRAHGEFKKIDLDARQRLYRSIAEKIWNPNNLIEGLSY